MSKERLTTTYFQNRLESVQPSPPRESLLYAQTTSRNLPIAGSGDSTGIKHFYEMPYGNPHFREDQRRVLDSLAVGRLDEILPSDLAVYFHDFQDKIGNHIIKLPEKTVVKISVLPNHTATIRRMRRITPWWAPLPYFRITDYYDVDGQNNTAWDVFQLLHPIPKHSEENKPTKPLEVVSVPPILNAFFAPTRYLNLLMLNRLSADSFLGRLLSKSQTVSKILKISDALIPGHESGHKWQFREYFPFEAYPKTPAHIKLKTLFLPILGIFFPGATRRIREELQTYKTEIVEQERNAHAFALSAGRRLRDLGLDILRGYNTDEIAGAVNFALSSYDKAFKNLPGPLFSHKKGIMYQREKTEKVKPQNVSHPSLQPAPV